MSGLRMGPLIHVLEADRALTALCQISDKGVLGKPARVAQARRTQVDREIPALGWRSW
jgi:hypothetical protein